MNLYKKWHIVELKDITVSLDSRRIPIESSIRQTKKGKYPYYGASGIIDYIDDFIFEEETLLVGEDGANLLARTTPIAFKAVGKYWVNNHAHILKVTEKADINFLCYFLNQLDLTPYITGSAQPKLTADKLHKLKIPLPPLPEQKRIAAILEKCDRLRRTRRYSLQLSETFLQSVFLEMFGNLETNSKDWNLIPFDDVCTIDAEMVDPKLPEFCNLLHIGAANIESITGNILNLQTAGQEKLISSKFLINPEHILFSKIRPKLRKVAFPQIHGLCSADVYPIRIKSFSCNQYFLLHFFRSNYFSNLVSELAESRTNIPKINREELSEQSIPLPPLPLQEKFAQIVQKHERFRTQQREAERQAEHLFQTLLHRAFRGELTDK